MGIESQTQNIENLKITKTKIKSKKAAEKLGKLCGDYITIECKNLAFSAIKGNQIEVIAKQIETFLPKTGLVLVVGLGNSDITPDALGPIAAKNILATRHITGEVAKKIGIDSLRPVAVFSPGVLGQTGIETSELISSIVKKISPETLVIIDALASRDTKKLGATVQFSNTGISPGSGVGNSRKAISQKNMGIPVISMGVPTVVDATTLAADLFSGFGDYDLEEIIKKTRPKGAEMMVTPREIDSLIEQASKLVGMALNCALQPEFSQEEILALI